MPYLWRCAHADAIPAACKSIGIGSRGSFASILCCDACLADAQDAGLIGSREGKGNRGKNLRGGKLDFHVEAVLAAVKRLRSIRPEQDK